MEGLRYEAIPHSTDADSIIGGCRKCEAAAACAAPYRRLRAEGGTSSG